MAHFRNTPKRKAAEKAQEGDSDSDCIAVSSQPLQRNDAHATGQTRPPLAHVNASHTHNKRRRILEYVLIPKPPAATQPHVLPSTQRRSQHTSSVAKERQRLPARTPLPGSSVQIKRSAQSAGPKSQGSGAGTTAEQAPKQASILNFFGASGRVAAGETTTSSSTPENFSGTHPTTQRPKRNTKRSLYPPIELDESSEDELVRDDQAPKRGAAKTKAKVKASTEAEESEYEAEGAISSAEDVSEEDGDAFDDSSSVAPSEHLTDEEEVEMKAGPPKVAARATAETGSRPKTAKKATAASADDMQRMLERPNGQSRGLDPNLPPLSSIDDIFRDMTQRALGLGFDTALDRLRARPIRVATMCSGTESPLLALQMVRDALGELGLPAIDVQHIFSAEIVPYKQAYIERNFAPPIIFRDITEFPNAFKSDHPAATTAYGSSVPIPTGVDVVVAGTSCVDFSKLNNKKKKLSDNGESGLTWKGALAYCSACRPAIIIFENVLKAEWSLMLAQYRAIGYDCKGVKVDSKDFYMPQTRQRGYMVCFDKLRTKGDKDMGSQWQTLMDQFRRYASSPVSSFLLTTDQVVARQPARSDENRREVDWSRCVITQMQYRQDKEIGSARPFTQWQESGAMVPPENGSAPWYHKQVERVLDTIDCNILRKSLPEAGMYDARFKTRIWDLSQNIYFFTDHSPFGITGCITPSGQFFASDAGRQLSYEECLMLQGIPLSKISFTTETPKNVQDLAGNAMTSTVVGSALLAALIVGHDLIDVGEVHAGLSGIEETTPAPTLYRNSSEMQLHACESKTADLDVLSLLRGAESSSRKCHCEGSHGLCEKPLQQCTDCGHTTCTSCGGSPPHNFRQDQSLDDIRTSPSLFEQQLKSQLPLRLSFIGIGDFASLFSGLRIGESPQYQETVRSAATGVFNFQRVRRTYCWTASYVSQDARLDLVIEGIHVEWRLFALPPKSLACNDKLRSNLEQPIAKAAVSGMLFDLEWLWRVPQKRTNLAHIVPQGSPALTWWARNDVPGYGTHSQPDQLHVEVYDETSALLERSISGTYHYLPKCGKACDSLYQKVGKADGDRPMYLFLDPTLTGDPEMDHFVFSHNKAQLEYDEARPVIARIQAPWRPWTVGPDDSAIPDAKIVFDAVWQTAPFAIALQPHLTALGTHTLANLPALTEGSSCQDACLLASCTTGHGDPGVMELDQPSVNMANDARFLSHNAWIFEAMRRQLSDRGWQTVASDELVADCSSCAPAKPLLRWKFVPDQKTLAPYEDPASAAAYERAVKARPAPMIVTLAARDHGEHALEFGVSIASLTHRALARMPRGVQNLDVRWKLDTSNTRSMSTSFPPFVLKATKGLPYTADLDMSVSLFPKQRLSLAWMRSQEEGEGKRIEIEDAEEATLPVHGWRVEVRASAPIFVRGGICADHPGFGKTITSLALIQAQLLESTPAQIKDVLKARQTGASEGLIASTATVIICPNSLVQQWFDEIQDKLGRPKGVITVKVTAHFSRYSIQDFENAKIILVSRSVMGTETYAERLAAFAAIPGPTATTGRAFAQWLQFATSRIPEHLQVLKTAGVNGLRSYVKAKYSEIIRSEDFKAAVPSKRLRGKDLAAAQSGKKASDKAKPSSLKPATATISVSDIDKPLLEMFYFNRIIIDEFHQHEPHEHAAITALQADKRWALSATPELGDFFDIARMASLLGVPLRMGSDSGGIMKAKNVKKLRQHMTNFELFDAMRQMPSSSMHARIHELDQLFLDTFVRRNIMDFAELPYEDTLNPVTLDLDHRAMYTELSQHLNSSQMRIKKGKKAGTTDRQDRLHAAIATSESAEEALSRTAAFFERDVDAFADSGAGLAAAISVRDQEAQDLVSELEVAIRRASDEEPDPFRGWKKTKVGDGTLGDGATISDVQLLIATAAKGRSSTGIASKSKSKSKRSNPDVEEDGEEEEEATAPGGKRELTAIVNGLCDRLVTSRRSLRYLQNIQTLQRGAKGSATTKAYCDSDRCLGYVQAKHDVAVSAFCGHMVCKDCYRHLRDEQHGKQCPASGCSSAMDPHHLLWTSKMGNLHTTVHTPYGAKIDAAMDILEDVRTRDDQAILFVQFDQQVGEVEKALKDRQISAVVVKDLKKAASQIAQFRESTEHTVIVLNSSDETAAGSNLQNANHVIFLSPLLKSDQYGYESTMAQAIGRVRRHGQKKQIHVYRIVALDTIDVDILEHRERRLAALTEHGAPRIVPPTAARELDMHDEPKPERTQLVKENGQFSLRPQSWLVRCGTDAAGADEIAKVKGKNRVLGWEDFSSLVKFSRAYTEDDD